MNMFTFKDSDGFFQNVLADDEDEARRHMETLFGDDSLPLVSSTFAARGSTWRSEKIPEPILLLG